MKSVKDRKKSRAVQIIAGIAAVVLLLGVVGVVCRWSAKPVPKNPIEGIEFEMDEDITFGG